MGKTKPVAEITKENNLLGANFTSFCDGAKIGEAIAKDARMPLVLFTRISKVDPMVQQSVNRRIGEWLLELSGNNVIIVKNDADIALVVRPVLFAAVGTGGSRLPVQERVYQNILNQATIGYSLHEKQRSIFYPAYEHCRKGMRVDILVFNSYDKWTSGMRWDLIAIILYSFRELEDHVAYNRGYISTTKYFFEQSMLTEGCLDISHQYDFGNELSALLTHLWESFENENEDLKGAHSIQISLVIGKARSEKMQQVLEIQYGWLEHYNDGFLMVILNWVFEWWIYGYNLFSLLERIWVFNGSGNSSHCVLRFNGGHWSSNGDSILAHGYGGFFHLWKNVGVSFVDEQPQTVPFGHYEAEANIDEDVIYKLNGLDVKTKG